MHLRLRDSASRSHVPCEWSVSELLFGKGTPAFTYKRPYSSNPEWLWISKHHNPFSYSCKPARILHNRFYAVWNRNALAGGRFAKARVHILAVSTSREEHPNASFRLLCTCSIDPALHHGVSYNAAVTVTTALQSCVPALNWDQIIKLNMKHKTQTGVFLIT
jgi:hypothetical protein